MKEGQATAIVPLTETTSDSMRGKHPEQSVSLFQR